MKNNRLPEDILKYLPLTARIWKIHAIKDSSGDFKKPKTFPVAIFNTRTANAIEFYKHISRSINL